MPAASPNPYHEIFDRDAFRLKTPPVQRAELEPAPPPTLTLTGITTILGDKRVFLKILPAAKPYQPPPKEQSCMLTEGQRYGQVQVLAIDEKTGHVKVKVGDSILGLSFEKNGVRAPQTAAASPHRLAAGRLPEARRGVAAQQERARFW